MPAKRLKSRVLKRKVYELLKSSDFNQSLEELVRFPHRQVINALLSFLYSGDDEIRWRAISGLGAVVSKFADEDMEGARVILRRLMWNLNDESGGIGWGSPEAMGDILACHGGLADEYVHMLISYTREDGNYLEHELLQRGLLWGIGRLAGVRPDHAKKAAPYLIPFLKSPDSTVRGLAAWIMGLTGLEEARPALEHLMKDEAEFFLYSGHILEKRSVKELAGEALNIFKNGEIKEPDECCKKNSL